MINSPNIVVFHDKDKNKEGALLCKLKEGRFIKFRFHGGGNMLDKDDVEEVVQKLTKNLNYSFNYKLYKNKSQMTSYLKKEYFEKENIKFEKNILPENEYLLKDPKNPLIKEESNDDSDSNSYRKPVLKMVSNEELMSNNIASARRIDTSIKDYFMNQRTFKKIQVLKYRENVFRAACKLMKELPPYPNWSYKSSDQNIFKTAKINVGGEIFEIFHKTVINLCHTKIGKLMKEYNPNRIPFVDRDPNCFNVILNFYRTGRLHVPANVCLTFFEEELSFWGIHEDFLGRCCLGDYFTAKVASNKLKKYSEDIEKTFMYGNDTETGDTTVRAQVYKILISGTGNICSRWVSLLCAMFITMCILSMIASTTVFGRLEILNNDRPSFSLNESVNSFLIRTKISPSIEMFDLIACGFFLAELLLRLFLCPMKLEFFRDIFNWIDMIATITSLISLVLVKEDTFRKLEAYTIVLKLPRIFRLLKLTANLRSGIDAFVLTLIASAKELELVFFILIMSTVIFGSIMFSVEMLDKESSITSIYIGMWWAIETLPGVGYGDYVPITMFGKVVGAICMMLGVIICQMPVPVFLKNFAIYYNQASARRVSQHDLLLCQNINKCDLLKYEKEIHESRLKKKIKKSENTRAYFDKIKNIFS